ncbi:M56 family metallopeptidase [Paenibacillus sp. GYB003]|uniref:M56 family metallopeptidase n=1 Tax=Paenibacillus sp. GYB003 TaxID=2994392 RepID=UPI002F96CDDB
MNWHTRSERLYRSSLLLAVFIFTQMGTYALQIVLGGSFGFNVFEACSGLLMSIGMPVLAYALDALVVATIVTGLWQTARQLYHTRKARTAFLRRADTKKTEELLRKFGLPGTTALAVIAHSAPLAFTMGLYRPHIVVSSGLIELLSDEELGAVLHHERHHQASRDPLRSFVLGLCASVVWYLPILKWTSGQFRIARELLADEYAVSRSGGFEPVAGALLKLARCAGRTDKPFLHASFAETSINYRIMRLVDPLNVTPPKLPARPAIGSAAIAAALTVAFICTLQA